MHSPDPNNRTGRDRLRRSCAAPLPHPGSDELERATRQVMDFILRRSDALGQQTIGRSASRRDMEARLRQPPSEEGLDFATVLSQFEERVVPFALRLDHPRFLAYIPAAPSYASILADCLCAATNFFAGVWLEAAGPTQVELVVLDWFKEMLGYPASAQGVLTSGGSEANLLALVLARDTLAWNDRTDAILYVNEQRHWSIDRAAKIVGLHPDQLRILPARPDQRWDVERLESAIAQDRDEGRHPWALIASAGTTNTGAVDPLEELALLARRQKLWLHVDAAYGWPAVLTPAGKALLAGIERADSITLDPHKWFAQTYDAGCLLVREGERLPAAFAQSPDYLQGVAPADDEVNFADRGLALTRRFRALKIWFAVKVLGLGWFRQLIEHGCCLAEYAQCLLDASPHFEVVSPRSLSVVCFRCLHPTLTGAALDAWNLQVESALRESGRAMLSSTRLRGRIALRLCFVNWQTTSDDVEEVIGALESLCVH